MRKRAEQVGETGQRIIDAAIRLHTTVGPASTTITALAEQARVTRLTVYRHFPDEDALYSACGEPWRKEHPAPDVATWREIRSLEARARHGLRELYGWYRDHGDELMPLYRTSTRCPQRHVRRHSTSSNGSPTR